MGDEDVAGVVSAEEWTREQGSLADISDLLQGIRSVLIAAHSKGSGPRVRPAPRPTTAIEQARARAVRARHAQRVAALTGNRDR